jgi:hypothetical protein
VLYTHTHTHTHTHTCPSPRKGKAGIKRVELGQFSLGFNDTCTSPRKAGT